MSEHDNGPGSFYQAAAKKEGGATDVGWTEWSRHVLNSLDRLGIAQEKTNEKFSEFKEDVERKLNEALGSIKADISSIQGKVASYEPTKMIGLQVDVEALKVRSQDHEMRIRALETTQTSFGGKWTIIAAIGAAILAGFVSLFFSLAKAEPLPQESIATPAPITYTPPPATPSTSP